MTARLTSLVPSRHWRTNHPLRLVAVPTAAVLVLAACSTGGSDGSGGAESVTRPGSVVTKADRQAAPRLAGETLDGRQLDVSDFRGKVVVLNFWASHCGPCRLEAPHFTKVAKETKAKGVEFVGINTRNTSRTDAVNFERDFGVAYPSLYDPDGKLMLRFPRGSLNPQAIPSTIVIDREGRIAARYLGPLSDSGLREMVTAVAAEQ
ncbi:TlpA disulfide reductase family protein [Streptomyces sannanensis]|uniref:TlpA disulfide reductase family protein n=1 Tax=Streptomyces sannanensis TaxID=285536 RepID=A0ABP6SFQ3_9ACTN